MTKIEILQSAGRQYRMLYRTMVSRPHDWAVYLLPGGAVAIYQGEVRAPGALKVLTGVGGMCEGIMLRRLSAALDGTTRP